MLAPIPGMSLTTQPRNTPYEQPPLYPEPEKALAFYLDKLDNPDIIDDTMFLLEHGVTLESFINALTSTGAMEGIHTVDVKILISPILHEYLANLAKAAGVKFTEFDGPSKEQQMNDKYKKRMLLVIRKDLADTSAPPQQEEEKAETLLGMPNSGAEESQESFGV